MRGETVTLDLTFHHQTPDAWLVSKDGMRMNAVWVPKSQCELVSPTARKPEPRDDIKLEMPGWLAQKQDFI